MIGEGGDACGGSGTIGCAILYRMQATPTCLSRDNVSSKSSYVKQPKSDNAPTSALTTDIAFLPAKSPKSSKSSLWETIIRATGLSMLTESIWRGKSNSAVHIGSKY